MAKNLIYMFTNYTKMLDIIDDVKSHYSNEKQKIGLKLFNMEKKKKINWDLPKNKQMKAMMVVEIHLLNVKMKELDIRQIKIEHKIHSLCKMQLVGCFTFKRISTKNKTNLEKETCSICIGTHKIKDILITKCTHHFGECCFGKYVENKLNNDLDVFCPLCRANNILPVIKYY